MSIIVSSLRGSNKSNTISVTRQNGTYTISQLSKMLRFARTVDAIDGGDPSICITNVPLPTKQPLVKHTSIQFTSIDGGQTTLACVPADNSNPPYLTISSNSASLLDTSAVQIPPNSCQITCNQTTISDALIVGIKFSLVAKTASGGIGSVPEFTASASAVEFNTSVILRNVGR